MSQQINLYTPPVKISFWQQTRPFPQLVMLLCVVLLLLYLFFWWWAEQVHDQWHDVSEQLQQFQRQLDAMRDVAPPENQEAGLQKEVVDLEQRIKGQQGLKTTLNREGLVSGLAFSDYLTGIALMKPEGVWFSQMEFYQGGRQVLLKGQAISSQLVPQLVSRLGQYPAFERIRFEQASINQPDPDQPVSFDLGSVPSASGGGK